MALEQNLQHSFKRLSAIDRIEEQLQRIERMMLALVDGVDLDALTAYERLNITVKLMQQHARLLAMRQNVESAQPEKAESIMLGVLMKQLRGEVSEDQTECGH